MDWLDDWYRADTAAMRATRAAAEKSILALQRRGELPSEAEQAEIRRLRECANILFRDGMAAAAAMRATLTPRAAATW